MKIPLEDLCGIQRLMQALGAYGVIGILREKKEFLRHIQPAIKTLIDVILLPLQRALIFSQHS
jgi:hypothetical protein